MASSPTSDLAKPRPPSPDNDHTTTVIVIVFVSFGGLLVAAFLAFAFYCLMKKVKKRCKKSKEVEEAGVLCVDEHKKVKEQIVEGCDGPKTVVLEIEDDVHVGGVVVKKEKEVDKFGSALGGGEKGDAIQVVETSTAAASAYHPKHSHYEHKV